MRIALRSVHLAPPPHFLGLTGLGACILVPNSSPAKYADHNTGVPCDPNAAASSPATITPSPGGFAPAPPGTVETSIPGFMGTTAVPPLTSFLQSDLAAITGSDWNIRSGNAMKPDACPSTMKGEADMYCNLYPTACAGVDRPSLVSSLCAQYSSIYQGKLTNYYDLVNAGSIEPAAGAPPPPAGYKPSGVVTSGPAWKALQTAAPVTGGAPSNSTGGGGGAQNKDASGGGAGGNKESGGNGEKENGDDKEGFQFDFSWFNEMMIDGIPNWILLVGAAGAIWLASSAMRGRR